MDAVDRVISGGRHLAHNKKLIGQTWREFEEASTGEFIFLFGIGDGADYYFLIELIYARIMFSICMEP